MYVAGVFVETVSMPKPDRLAMILVVLIVYFVCAISRVTCGYVCMNTKTDRVAMVSIIVYVRSRCVCRDPY